MEALDPHRSRWLLAAWAATAFALSAVTDLRVLGAAAVVAPLVLWRQASAAARRLAVTVLPLCALLVAASWGWLRLVVGVAPAWPPFAALFLRTLVIAFVTFAVLKRVDLLGAVRPWPTLTRLVVITLAQAHALRLLARESVDGLTSRLPRRPRARDAVRGAGGVTVTLLTLATRNARDVTDALRSRGAL